MRFYLIRLLVTTGTFLYRVNAAIGALILVLSRPSDLVEMVKRRYQESKFVQAASKDPELKGLTEKESQFVVKYLPGKKRCLVFGSGGGRESFALARMGFEVTGIDTSSVLIENSNRYALQHALTCRFELRDLFKGPTGAEKYDALFATQLLYSAIPTRRRRITFLEKTRTFLAENGVLYLEFWVWPLRRKDPRLFRLKQKVAALCRGNRELEEGDTYLWAAKHFSHIFTEVSEVLGEIEESGLFVVENQFANGTMILSPHRR